MDPYLVYQIAIGVAIALGLLWSFVFDKNKPPSKKELVAKFLARTLLILVLFVVVMGFLNIAFGVFGS